jgi:hypothetical protein
VIYPGVHRFDCGHVEHDDWNAVIDIPYEQDQAAGAGVAAPVPAAPKQAQR